MSPQNKFVPKILFKKAKRVLSNKIWILNEFYLKPVVDLMSTVENKELMKSSLKNVGYSVGLFFYDCRFVNLFTAAQKHYFDDHAAWQILK